MEGNTFWYMSVPLFDYVLRYFGLRPVDFLFTPHKKITHSYKLTFDKPSGYLSVLCVAENFSVAADKDEWMEKIARSAYEMDSVRWKNVRQAPLSDITYNSQTDPSFIKTDTNSVNLWDAVQGAKPVEPTTLAHNTHLLKLADRI